MRKLFLSLVAMLFATVSFAQNTLVATLTHGDDIKMFYGAFALRDAHNAAANGDVINLSGGGFQAVKITKALVIRGTGIDITNPTYITGNFDIDIPADVTDRLSFEGCRISNTISILGTLKNPYFMKSSIGYIDVYSKSNMDNCTFANCQVSGMHLNGKSSVQFLNSHIEEFNNYAESNATASFINCVIRPYYGDNAGVIRSSLLVNSILYWTSNVAYSLPATSSAMNCVAVGDASYNAFKDLMSKQNCSYAGMDIFKDSNAWNDLTEEAKEKYLGNDGKPVGMYGGILPYNTTPSYPQITKMNVASKTTADGKLSVEIEVSAAQ